MTNPSVPFYNYGRAGSWTTGLTGMEHIAYDGHDIIAETRLLAAGAQAIDIKALTVMEWADANKTTIQVATAGSTNRVAGVLSADVPAAGKTNMSVPLMLSGKFNRRALVWDASFDAPAKCYAKFAPEAPNLLLDERNAPTS